MRRHVIYDGGSEVSEVLVGRDVMRDLTSRVEASHTKVAVLCQPSTTDLADRYGSDMQAAGLSVTAYTLPDAEDAKRLSVVEDVYRLLNRSGFTRDDVVVGVGGGALTDVAGFIAATYLRGVSAVYVPTTVLGAVDAAIGGKTAVNVDGKNIAGVFAHPRTVFIDVDTLDDLPRSQKVQGAAEAIKTGFIADMEIVNAYESHPTNVDLESIVNRSVAVKVAVVNEDFTEQGTRAILNYGHTVGHAIETASGISHGEAVAIGMVAAGAASEAVFGFTGNDRQRTVLADVGLPTHAPVDMKIDRIRSLIALDKKRDANGLRLVLLREFEVPVVVPADDATVRAAFEGIGLTS
jgi:3-dehydroquinate synthase